MATAKFIDDPTFQLTLQRAETEFPKVAEAAIFAGAGVVADKMRAALNKTMSPRARGLLVRNFGITPTFVDRDANYNAHVGFDGYDPKGTPFQLLARVKESGRRDQEGREATHFARNAAKESREEMLAAMRAAAEKELENITKKT